MPKFSSTWTTIRTLSAQTGESSTPASGVFISVNGVDELTMVEFNLAGMSVTGSPTSVTFQVWRYVGLKIDALESATYTPAGLTNALPIRSVGNGLNYWVTVSFTGGTTPAITGTISARPVSDASTPANQTPAGGPETIVKIADPVSGVMASVLTSHLADNLVNPATVAGMTTSGIAQLLNAMNNSDRQRSTYADNIPSVGIAAGTQQLKSPIATTLNGSTLINATSLVLTAAKLTNFGAPAWIQVGSILSVDTGANQEYVFVTAINYGTLVATVYGLGTGTGMKFAHNNGVAITSSAYNEARDGTGPDSNNGAGLSASITYLKNINDNAGVGGYEAERSAAGECDDATGVGSAIAVEYEWNGKTYDRARSVSGKAMTTTTLAAQATAGDLTVNMTSIAGLVKGQPITLTSATPERVLVTQGWDGSTNPVPIQSAVVTTHANGSAAIFEIYGVSGPGLNGFTCYGMGIEEEALYDPTTNLFYIERSASTDAMAKENIVAEAAVLFNGATYDRPRGATKFISLTALATNAEITAWTPTSGKKFRLMGFCLSPGTAGGNFTFKDNTGGSTILVVALPSITGSVSSPVMGNGILSAAINNVLTITGPATSTLSGFLFGTEE